MNPRILPTLWILLACVTGAFGNDRAALVFAVLSVTSALLACFPPRIDP